MKMGPFDHTIDVSLYYPCGTHGMSPLQSIKTLEMGDENMEKREFKIGDKIRITNGSYMKSNGKIATIVNIDCSDYRPYHVQVHETKDIIYLDPEEMELVEEKKMENVKSLLKSGDIVVFGSGEKAKVFLDYESNYYGKGILAYTDKDSFMALSSYDDNLLTSSENEYYTINKIYRPKSDGYLMSKNLNDYDLIWERKEVKEMTMKEICEALGYEVKIKKEDK